MFVLLEIGYDNEDYVWEDIFVAFSPDRGKLEEFALSKDTDAVFLSDFEAAPACYPDDQKVRYRIVEREPL